jgi:MSHA biogenesis protein MshM
LSDENLEALRLLLNYHVPQRKLLNILLFGQGELETRIHARGNLADRVDSWIRLNTLDEPTTLAVLDYRLTRAGLAPGTQTFTPEARTLIAEASAGIPRRMTMIAHLAMQEAADRASTLVIEDHVRTSLLARGISPRQKPAAAPVAAEQPATSTNGAVEPERPRSFFSRLFPRRA